MGFKKRFKRIKRVKDFAKKDNLKRIGAAAATSGLSEIVRGIKKENPGGKVTLKGFGKGLLRGSGVTAINREGGGFVLGTDPSDDGGKKKPDKLPLPDFTEELAAKEVEASSAADRVERIKRARAANRGGTVSGSRLGSPLGGVGLTRPRLSGAA